MKKLFALMSIASALLMTGCSTITLNDTTANWAGMTFHQAYTKIAEKQDDAFRADVEDLWTEIDKVDTVEGLTNVYIKVANKIDTLVMKKDLTEKQVAVIKILRKILDKAVATALSTDAAKQSKAIAWLSKFRDGIRTMRSIENNGENSEAELPKDEDINATPEEEAALAAILKSAKK